MRYDTHTPEQLVREIAYCDQELARRTSADRVRRLQRKRALLVKAQQRPPVRQRREGQR